eukprot:c5512_g1_i2.p1 GENE.c5512_g1_i2~~c5512_g1_i2.p1  ORF type:complete len:117 (+),score=9.09 c5512_g1_i2:2-352(+)
MGARLVADMSADELALLEAARQGNLAEVTSLLAKGTNARVSDKRGNTPVYWACRYGFADVVRVLLEHGADPHFPNVLGNTPISVARMFKHENVLLELGDHCEGTTEPPTKNRRLGF